jgi:hypothetical protein
MRPLVLAKTHNELNKQTANKLLEMLELVRLRKLQHKDSNRMLVVNQLLIKCLLSCVVL